MSDIKTRDVVEGTAKVVDKSAVAAGRMKDAYIRTKQKAENSVYSGESSPEEYASDRVSGGIETVIHESVDKINKYGQKIVKSTKDNISKVKEHFKREQLIDPLKKQAEKQTGNVIRHTSDTVQHTVGYRRKGSKNCQAGAKVDKDY